MTTARLHVKNHSFAGRLADSASVLFPRFWIIITSIAASQNYGLMFPAMFLPQPAGMVKSATDDMFPCWSGGSCDATT